METRGQRSRAVEQSAVGAAASKQVDLLAGPSLDRPTKISLKDLAAQNELPEVYVSTVPAELLQTHGEPQVVAIPNTQLLYVTNTQNDIFVYTATQEQYILVAGRWFGAQSMKGPWTYVAPDKLPAISRGSLSRTRKRVCLFQLPERRRQRRR